MTVWTEPRTFEHTNVVNRTILNKFVPDNLAYLFSRPRSVVNNSEYYSTTSTSFVAVSEKVFRVGITVQAPVADLLVWFNGSHRHSDNGTQYQEVTYDFLMDGETYLSSDSDTPLSNGLARMGNRFGASVYMKTQVLHVIQDVPEGYHFFDLMWKTDVLTVEFEAVDLRQFGVREI